MSPPDGCRERERPPAGVVPGGGDGPIGVLVADDHAMFRQGLRAMLAAAEDVVVVGEAADGREAVSLVRSLKPDVVLLDVEMPGMGGADALGRMLRERPPPRVLVVSMHDGPRAVRGMLSRGASGYLAKSASLEELVAAVRRAARSPGRTRARDVSVAVPPAVLEALGGEGPLSFREQEVVLLAARGLSNPRIASALFLAEATVKRHLANAYKKMGVSSRGEATQVGLREGWITPQEVRGPAPGSH